MKKSSRLYSHGLLALLLVSVLACSRDPHATRLPMNLADIPTIEPQLAKLPSEERQLVLDYLNRSKGDVLPAQFADPDEPLTARTFAEAIKLQREFNVKHAAQTAKADALRANREDAMEPLRQVLLIELVNREILPSDQASGRQPSRGQAINDKPVLITTYRLRNVGIESITEATGSVTIRAASDPGSLLGLASCYISQTEPIPASQSVEVRCGNHAKRAGEADEAYVAMPESSLVLTWEPKSITFGSGKTIRAEL